MVEVICSLTRVLEVLTRTHWVWYHTSKITLFNASHCLCSGVPRTPITTIFGRKSWKFETWIYFSAEFAFFLAGEICNSIPWVRCAFGNVWDGSQCNAMSHFLVACPTVGLLLHKQHIVQCAVNWFLKVQLGFSPPIKEMCLKQFQEINCFQNWILPC